MVNIVILNKYQSTSIVLRLSLRHTIKFSESKVIMITVMSTICLAEE